MSYPAEPKTSSFNPEAIMNSIRDHECVSNQADQADQAVNPAAIRRVAAKKNVSISLRCGAGLRRTSDTAPEEQTDHSCCAEVVWNIYYTLPFQLPTL